MVVLIFYLSSSTPPGLPVRVARSKGTDSPGRDCDGMVVATDYHPFMRIRVVETNFWFNGFLAYGAGTGARRSHRRRRPGFRQSTAPQSAPRKPAPRLSGHCC